MRKAFTLIELLVAILVLLAVLLASGSIFNATSKVTGVGEAVSDVTADLQAFERAFRDDLSSITRDGYLLIRCVAVRNDIRIQDGRGVLLDPGLPASHVFRCDQILFFRTGISGSKNYAQGAGSNNQGRSSAHRIYYGHAFQLAEASVPPTATTYFDVRPFTGNFEFLQLPPWADTGTVNPAVSLWEFNGAAPDSVNPQSQGITPIPTVPSSSWLLSRQSVMMADDADTGSPYLYLDGPFDPPGAYWNDGVPASPSIFTQDPIFYITPSGPQQYFSITGGRVDATTMSIADAITATKDFAQAGSQLEPLGGYNKYSVDFKLQRKFASTAGLFWPRGESQPPSTSRISIPPSRHIMSSSCSSIRIEWSWADGVAAIDRFPNQPGLNRGVQNFSGGDIWNPAPANSLPQTGRPYFRSVNIAGEDNLLEAGGLPFVLAECPNELSGEVIPIFENRPESFDGLRGPFYEVPISGIPQDNEDRIAIYEAFFGTNSNQPFVSNENPRLGSQDDGTCVGLGLDDFRSDWTPWPESIRVTATIHDKLGRLAAGQTTQFVVPLPRNETSE